MKPDFVTTFNSSKNIDICCLISIDILIVSSIMMILTFKEFCNSNKIFIIYLRLIIKKCVYFVHTFIEC